MRYLAFILSFSICIPIYAEFIDPTPAIRALLVLLQRATDLRKQAQSTDPTVKPISQLNAAHAYEALRTSQPVLLSDLTPIDLNTMFKNFLKAGGKKRKAVLDFLVGEMSASEPSSKTHLDSELRRLLYDGLNDTDRGNRYQLMSLMERIDPVDLGLTEDFYSKANEFLTDPNLPSTFKRMTLLAMDRTLSPKNKKFGKLAILALFDKHPDTVSTAHSLLAKVKPTQGMIDKAFEAYKSSSYPKTLPPVPAEWNKSSPLVLRSAYEEASHAVSSYKVPAELTARLLGYLSSTADPDSPEFQRILQNAVMRAETEIKNQAIAGLKKVINPSRETVSHTFEAMKKFHLSEDGTYEKLGEILSQWGKSQKSPLPIDRGLIDIAKYGPLEARQAAAKALFDGAISHWWVRDSEQVVLLAIDPDVIVRAYGRQAIRHFEFDSLPPYIQRELIQKALLGSPVSKEDGPMSTAKRLSDFKEYLEIDLIQKTIKETLEKNPERSWPALRALTLLVNAYPEVPEGEGTQKIFETLMSAKTRASHDELLHLVSLINRPDIGDRVAEYLTKQELPTELIEALIKRMGSNFNHKKLVQLLGKLKYDSKEGKTLAIDYLINSILLGKDLGEGKQRSNILREYALLALGTIEPTRAQDFLKIAKASQHHSELSYRAGMPVGTDGFGVPHFKTRMAARFPRTIQRLIYGCAVFRPGILQ